MRYSDDFVISVLQDLQDGLTVAEVCRKYNVTRSTVDNWRANNGRSRQSQMGTKKRMSVGKILRPYVAQRLAANHGNTDKSTRRLTSAKVFQDLKAPDSPVRELNFSQRTVDRLVQELRPSFKSPSRRRIYLELSAEPASAQVDFGTVHLFLNGVETKMELLVCALPYSNMRFAWLLPAQNFVCFAEGMSQIFQAIGGVPKFIRFDNAKIFVSKWLQSNAINEKDLDNDKFHFDRNNTPRLLTAEFIKFKNYYCFLDEFCNPASGHEKGSVENAVGFYKRHWFAAPPAFDGDYEAFNKKLLEFAFDRGKCKRAGTNLTCLQLFEQEKAMFMPLPREPYEAFDFSLVKLNKYGYAKLDTALYQVRTQDFNLPVYMKSTWNKVEFYTSTSSEDIFFENQSELEQAIQEGLTNTFTKLNEYPRDYSFKRSKFVDWLTIFDLVCQKPRSLRTTMLNSVLPAHLMDFLCRYYSSDRKIILSALKSHLHENNIEPVKQVLADCFAKVGSRNLPAEEVALLIRSHGEQAPDHMAELALPGFIEPKRDDIDLARYDSICAPIKQNDDEPESDWDEAETKFTSNNDNKSS